MRGCEHRRRVGPGSLPTLWLESGARPAAPPCLRCRRRRLARLPRWDADLGCRRTRLQHGCAARCAMSQVPRRRAAGAASDPEAAVDNSLAPQMPRRAWTPGPRSMRGAAAAWDVLHLRWRRQHTRRQRRRVRFARAACSLCWQVSKTRPMHGFLERRLPCWTCLALWLCRQTAAAWPCRRLREPLCSRRHKVAAAVPRRRRLAGPVAGPLGMSWLWLTPARCARSRRCSRGNTTREAVGC